jgi:UDP-3-O-[3-hydroxymyristoyl] glucosamine N-acyltransferase
MTTAAQELLSNDGRPRKLSCRSLSLAEIARRHQMVLEGKDGEIQRFTSLSELTSLGGIAVTYLTSPRFANLLRGGDDIAVVTRAELRQHLQPGNIALLVSGDDPHDAFYAAFLGAVEGGSFEKLTPFVSPHARIHQAAVISDNVHIEAGAAIGAGAVVLPNTYVGADVVIKPNATVGGDGFENAIIRGHHTVVPHAGGVWLSEGVHVGSSTCIDRGLFGDFTFLGPHTTMDNLVHFAHSARTGKDCSLTACAEVSGGAVLGDGVWLAPNVAVNQSLTIGSHCFVGTGAVVTRNLLPHSLAWGSPARVIGRACVCRAKLEFENENAVCDRCGRGYRLNSEGQVQHA